VSLQAATENRDSADVTRCGRAFQVLQRQSEKHVRQTGSGDVDDYHMLIN